jgi:hypothetical protein
MSCGYGLSRNRLNQVFNRPGVVEAKYGTGEHCQPLFMTAAIPASEIGVVVSSRPGHELLVGCFVKAAALTGSSIVVPSLASSLLILV